MKGSKNSVRRAVICAVGSGGDVLPFARIADALARRGIEATLLAPGRYRSHASPGGARYNSIGADDVFDRVFDGPEVWHPTRGLAASWQYYGAAMRSGLSKIRQGWDPHDTVLVSSSFALAARMAEQVDGYRNLTVHLSPSLMWSAASPPTWTTGSVPPTWPLPFRRLAMSMAERAFVDPVIRAHVNPLRRELGLAPVRRVFSRHIHGQLVAYAFPEWFASAAADWPSQGRFAGFILQPMEEQPVDPALEAFLLRTSQPLVVVTAGTAVARRPAWVEHAAAKAVELGCKALIVSADSTPVQGSETMVIPYAPFPLLLPQAAVFVHHGGIGTIAEAIRAGVAQVVVPSAHDQPDNAARLACAGVSRSVNAGASPAAFRDALAGCLGDAAMRAAVNAAQARLAMQGDAADLIAAMALE